MLVLAFQDQIALAVLGETGAGLPTGGLTIGLLLAYGVFFLLGFALFALRLRGGRVVREPAGRPADAVAAAQPRRDGRLPLRAGRAAGRWRVHGPHGVVRAAAQPLRDALAADGQHVQPWEVALSVGILLVTIALVALATVRIYATGVLLYGQRPGIRPFIAAARRAG